jgi:hypothetical protein
MSLMRNKDGLTEKEFLERYDPSKFERPSVTVDMLIFTVLSKDAEDNRRLPDKDLYGLKEEIIPVSADGLCPEDL